MRPVLIGIAPSREGAEGQPLTSLGGRSTGKTLADLAGLSEVEYLRQFDRVNLCATVRRSTIAVREGKPFATMLAGSLLRARRVVLLGANVAACFGLERYELLRWYPVPGRPERRDWVGVAGHTAGSRLPFDYAVLPHPSARNRWFNEPENYAAAARFMQALAAHKTEET